MFRETLGAEELLANDRRPHLPHPSDFQRLIKFISSSSNCVQYIRKNFFFHFQTLYMKVPFVQHWFYGAISATDWEYFSLLWMDVILLRNRGDLGRIQEVIVLWFPIWVWISLWSVLWWAFGKALWLRCLSLSTSLRNFPVWLSIPQTIEFCTKTQVWFQMRNFQ